MKTQQNKVFWIQQKPPEYHLQLLHISVSGAWGCESVTESQRAVPSIPPSRWPLFRQVSPLRSGRSDPRQSTEPSPCRRGRTAPSGSGSALRPGCKSSLWLNWNQRRRPRPAQTGIISNQLRWVNGCSCVCVCVLVAHPNLLFHFDHAVTSDAVWEGDAVKGSACVLDVPNTHFNRVDANTPQLLPLTHTHRRKSA